MISSKSPKIFRIFELWRRMRELNSRSAVNSRELDHLANPPYRLLRAFGTLRNKYHQRIGDRAPPLVVWPRPPFKHNRSYTTFAGYSPSISTRDFTLTNSHLLLFPPATAYGIVAWVMTPRKAFVVSFSSATYLVANGLS